MLRVKPCVVLERIFSVIPESDTPSSGCVLTPARPCLYFVGILACVSCIPLLFHSIIHCCCVEIEFGKRTKTQGCSAKHCVHFVSVVFSFLDTAKHHTAVCHFKNDFCLFYMFSSFCKCCSEKRQIFRKTSFV